MAPTYAASSIREAHPTGRDPEQWLVVPLDRRVRAMDDGIVVVDSAHPRLVWEPGGLVPRYAFAPDDVARDAQGLAEPLRQLDGLELVTVDWDAVDAWFEEDTRMHVHPQDPFHRIDVRDSSRTLEVTIAGAVVCRTTRPLLVCETGLPPRWYAPRLDVRMDLLEPSDTVTSCAYKGEARHWHARIDGELHEDACWTYVYPADPFHQLADRICFYDERVDEVRVDGELLPRPETQWS